MSLAREAMRKAIPVTSTAPSSSVAKIINGCLLMPLTIAMNTMAWPEARLTPMIPLAVNR